MQRYLETFIKKDLLKKMVLLGGPRQVGKTTLSMHLLKEKRGYYNWDVADHRRSILEQTFEKTPLLVLDEIHKHRSWRAYLKGLYDNPSRSFNIMVTGSARLDFYRFGGDSLQGRYFYYRLHPLSVAELKIQNQNDFLDLLQLGGFPEQFLEQSHIQSKRWSNAYRERFLRDDLKSLENIQDLGNLELLILRLPNLVGSPLSLNALREDLQVSHHSVRRWLDIIERLYGIFRLSPFGASKIRAVKKEQKHYHFDWTLIQERGLRFENMVACHLLKWIHFQYDVYGRELELRYFRDIDKREVDFVLMENAKPISFVECKWDEVGVSPGLEYIKKRFPKVPCIQISALGRNEKISSQGIEFKPALTYLSTLI